MAGKVNLDFVVAKDRQAIECSACHDLFFDRVLEDGRVIESAVLIAVDHARQVHKSNGGIIGGRKRNAPKWLLYPTM